MFSGQFTDLGDPHSDSLWNAGGQSYHADLLELRATIEDEAEVAPHVMVDLRYVTKAGSDRKPSKNDFVADISDGGTGQDHLEAHLKVNQGVLGILRNPWLRREFFAEIIEVASQIGRGQSPVIKPKFQAQS